MLAKLEAGPGLALQHGCLRLIREKRLWKRFAGGASLPREHRGCQEAEMLFLPASRAALPREALGSAPWGAFPEPLCLLFCGEKIAAGQALLGIKKMVTARFHQMLKLVLNLP